MLWVRVPLRPPDLIIIPSSWHIVCRRDRMDYKSSRADFVGP